jgi:hypothetical protein
MIFVKLFFSAMACAGFTCVFGLLTVHSDLLQKIAYAFLCLSLGLAFVGVLGVIWSGSLP